MADIMAHRGRDGLDHPRGDYGVVRDRREIRRAVERHRRRLRRAGCPADLRQLPPARAAARGPAAGVRPRRARRAALHHHPPGLRALVQAAAARGHRRPRRDALGRYGGDGRPGRLRTARGPAVVGPAPAPAHARHRARARPAGRRARDDDPAGLPRVPADPGPGQRLPVGAVPRAGVPLRRQGPVVRRALPRADPRRDGAAPGPARRADPVGRVPARAGAARASRWAATRR